MFRVLSLALIPIVTLTGEVSAFEYLGFHSGMTLQEAKQVSNQLVPVPGLSGAYSIGPFASSTINMSFCGDKLFALNAEIKGGVDAFASKTAEMNTLYAAGPTVQAQSSYGEVGLVSRVILTWGIAASEKYSVSLRSVAGQINVSTSISAFDALCK